LRIDSLPQALEAVTYFAITIVLLPAVLRARYRLSPHCVFVPDADGRSVLITHSLIGSRFRVDARVLAALMADDRAAQSNFAKKSPAQWTSVIRELVREQVLIDERSAHHTGSAPRNTLDPIDLAVLRKVNEGGKKPTRDGPAPAATKRTGRGHAISLETRSPAGAVKNLAECLSARESIRSYSTRPMSRPAFERFLQLTVRAYASHESAELGPTSLRNYPSAGARYPLEIYPVLLNVRSIERGFYHYHPFHHRLELLGHDQRYLDAVTRDCRYRMGRSDDDRSEPAALLIVTAVFSRTCWKYEGIPLHVILQETGALYQTMYLVATAMRLAPCAVGAFPERAVGEILGLDPAEEAQVGLFALGSRAPASSAARPPSVERFTVRRGSPFGPERTRCSIEVELTGGEKETIDARDFQVKRAGGALACAVRRGRRWAVFTGAALTSIRRLIVERNGVAHLRVGDVSVLVKRPSE